MMVYYANTIGTNHLGYAAIFICIGIGFFFIRCVTKKERGPGYWSATFLLNSVGFIFWSGIVPMVPWRYFLAGEAFHFLGFLTLVCGVYRFTGHSFKRWNAFAAGAILALWTGALLLFPSHREFATMSLRAVRSTLFLCAGALILHRMPRREIAGRRLAGISCVLWGIYNIAFGFFGFEGMGNFIFGFLVGFQVLASFGMLVMLVDRIRSRVEEKEKTISQLERLLPICAYCKKIRDNDNQWQIMEVYIEKRTTSQFSHGICPDCMSKHFPNFRSKKNG